MRQDGLTSESNLPPKVTATAEKYILAIDLGTSGPKTALVSTRGEVIACEFESVDLLILPNGGAEQKPDQWWQAIIHTAQKVLKQKWVPVQDIVCVSCTTQWSGTVAVDRDGHALGNAIIWMDARGSRYVKQVTNGLFNIAGYGIGKLRRWLSLTGGAPGHAGKDPLAHILFLKNEFPQLYRQAYKFLEPKDYINLKFCGRFAATFDSIALHWITDNRDLAKVKYDDRLIKICGLSREKFPELKRAVDILGPIKKEVAQELGLNEDIPVIAGTHDISSAAVGSGAIADFQGHLYVGTSSWITCHVPFKKTDLLHNMATLPSAIPERYFIANEQETAGACLNFLRDNVLCHKDQLQDEFGSADVYKIFDTIAQNTAAGSNNVIFMPWLYGERTPVENDSVRSGIFNLSLSTTREHLVRAIFEGVAYNSRWLLGYVEKFIKQRLDPIHIIGGGGNSNIWCQIFADVFERTIKQVKDPIQANLRGAAFLASVSLGYLAVSDISNYVQIANTYQPDPANRSIYDKLYREFLELYKKNKGIFQRLNAT
jgi:xylulokinase